MTTTTINVSTADELYDALAAATGGETIVLAGGNYGRLGLYGPRDTFASAYSAPVTIAAGDADNPPVFSNLDLTEVQNVGFDGVRFDYDAANGSPLYDKPFQVRDASNMTFKNVTFEGDLASGVSEINDGYGTGFGLRVTNSSDIAVTQSTFSNFHRGAVFNDVDGLSVIGNEVSGMSSDGFDFVAVQNTTISENYMHDFKKHPDSTAHMDMIQFWTNGVKIPSYNVTIEANQLISGAGDNTQSIFIRNEAVDSQGAGDEMLYRDFVIRDNIVYNAHSHGVTVSDVDGLKINSNTLIQNLDGADGSTRQVFVPGINVGGTARNVSLTNNIVPRDVNFTSDDVPVQIAGNVVTQSSDSKGTNYVGDIFVDALNGSTASIADLQIKPDWAYSGGVVGAVESVYNSAPDTFTPLMVVEQRETHDSTFRFDAALSADASGPLGADEANFTWEFFDADGAKIHAANGIAVEHDFAQVGMYKIVLTATKFDGTSATNVSRINIPDPLLFDLSVNANGILDGSSYDTGLVSDDLTSLIEETDRGYAMRVTDSSGVTLERGSPHLFGHDHISFEFGMRRDDLVDSHGALFRIHTAIDIAVTEKGELRFNFTNADEEKFSLETSGAGVSGTDWHHVVLSYDSEQEEATFYVDGEAVGSASMHGDTQLEESWAPEFGYAWGENFNGLVDVFAIHAESMDAETIKDRASVYHGNQASEDEGSTSEPIVPDYMLDFEGADEADQSETMTLKNGAAFAADLNGNQFVVLEDGGSYVNLGRPDEVFDNDAFSMLVDVKLDLEETNNDVRLLWNHLGFGLEVKGDMLSFRNFESDGDQVYTITKASGLNDGEWHNVGFALDPRSRELNLYYDGATVIQATLDDVSLEAGAGRDLWAGGTPWGRSLDGGIDDVAIFDHFIDSERVNAYWKQEQEDTLIA